jgi:GDP-mannose 6-dehydrogenase
MPNTPQSQTVAVFGLGYVGCVSAACLAELGHQVVGIDKDQRKVESVLAGRSPFFEPGLPQLIERGVAAKRLEAAVDVGDVLADADIALVCVGTPSQRDGNLTTDFLKAVSVEIARGVRSRPRAKAPLIVAVRSTVFPGTTEHIFVSSLTDAPVAVIVHPEFMREGSAVRDFQRPPLLVFGGPDAQVLTRAAQLYAALEAEPCFVSMRTAEMIKYACNTFHAVKIEFANEIGALCAHLGIDGAEVMETLCRDSVLNISPAYLKPGFAFGGSCLPKDLRALTFRARQSSLKLPLLESVLPGNEEHLKRALQAVLDVSSKRIGVFGLSFKENTDDLRESPVVTLLEQLIGKGRDVRVFDPQIRLDEIYGSNKAYIFSAIPHIGRLLDYDLEQMLVWADHVVIAQKPTPALADQIARSGRPILDLTAVTKPPSDA